MHELLLQGIGRIAQRIRAGLCHRNQHLPAVAAGAMPADISQLFQLIDKRRHRRLAHPHVAGQFGRGRASGALSGQQLQDPQLGWRQPDGLRQIALMQFGRAQDAAQRNQRIINTVWLDPAHALIVP